ncbi:SDR family NAD(P)-dependent oxidoreductase [Stutzerimonas azotifigens]|uniref:SDR family NAD(P)-dependent oxidoreductase n=1 Tax=Stutzerimonas azotifigens TaxID=291995 RepID=A0ABR5YYP1_9GAMM|nr:SDR family NAD(P)-dependent oxidoreductase [Stutzerimonas azotifigens]MBA1273025.1 SDR family NAD(P)-dependent oxidoreductase [Stutzerimonas azotifigens]
MSDMSKPLAVVTGASSGIGLELAKQFAQNGFDLLIASRGSGLDETRQMLQALGAQVESIAVDLGTYDGVKKLYAKARSMNRPVEAIAINAGVGVGGSFVPGTEAATTLESELNLIQLNVVSVVHIAKMFAKDLVAQGHGRMLFTSSISGTSPVPFEAVYGASKAFVRSFGNAIGNEMKGTGVHVTVLMPGPTETNFFHRAGEDDTQVGSAEKNDPAQVARQGFEALMAGQPEVYGGGPEVKEEGEGANRTESEQQKAERHRQMSEPGSA